MALTSSRLAGAGAAPRMSQLANLGASVVPSELKACVRFKRLEAVRGGPRIATYGFAEVCSMVIPAASTISAVRNSGNEGMEAAGTNMRAPVAMVRRPATIDRL